MNCWKTINLERDYGYTRMMISAISLTILFFILAFLSFQLTHPHTRLSSHNAPLFVVLLFVTLLVHRVVHLIPVMKSKKKMMLFKRNCWQHVPKKVMLYSLLSPFCVITPMYLVLGIMFPMYAHYFIIISSIHAGYCLPDFLFARKLLKAPKSCIINQAQDEFDILIDHTSSS
ncbi:DUF3267 domain-containing protein [Bacillus sp. 179-C3.3 HS]|uniref:DUF3267 domain-containing protein n=1 Tax=Bacillus sp. 179-C3.3 HS TaxID=3232162 RepID=UPI0039A002BC